MIRLILFIALIIFYAVRWRPSVLRRIKKKNINVTLLLLETLALFIILFQLSGAELLKFQAPVYLKYVGVCLVIFGLAFASTARLALKRNYLPALAFVAANTLTTHGPFKIVRHPSYLGTILAFIGLELALNSYIIFIILPILFFTLKQIKVEEKTLSEVHKDKWQKFIKDTPYKLVPLLY